VTRHHHAKLTPHPENGRLGFWRGDMVGGDIVDVFEYACEAHPDHLRDGCAACAAQGGTDDAS
jgi:hypothetical protein